MTESFIDVAFGQDGYFSKHIDNYEPRPAQVALSQAIYDAMKDKAHLIGEGPCGTGKSLAYLVPAVEAVGRGKKIVIATANIALQEQLVNKDLPDVARILPQKFTYAMLKGINNYLCLHKLAKGQASGEIFHPDMLTQHSQITEWAETTTTGDVSELPFVPDYRVWAGFSTTADDCLKRDCPMVATCNALKMRDQAKQADIVVTNYHLLFADLAVRAAGGQGVLPEYHVLILDEAHEAAEIARDFFGFQLTKRGLKTLCVVAKHLKSEEKTIKALDDAIEMFFTHVDYFAKSPNYNKRLRGPLDTSDMVRYLDILNNAANVEKESLGDDADKDVSAKLRQIIQRTESATKKLNELGTLADRNRVYWIQTEPNTVVMSKAIEAADFLRNGLYSNETIESVIAVSATMTTGSPHKPKAFDYIKQELGCPKDVRTIVVDSPFNFGKQAMIVVPKMPQPKDPNYSEAVAHATLATIKAAGGRTLGLYTSYKNLNASYAKVRYCGYKVFKQGDAPRTELVRQFRADVTSVLLGTESLWTGVDVQGDALSCVVIDRLPFPNPEDPVMDVLNERHKDAFVKHYVPRAVIAFRQGLGRLIRTTKDVGVMVVLDRRIVDTGWGKGFFWSSLPAGIQARDDINLIQPFLDWAKAQVA